MVASGQSGSAQDLEMPADFPQKLYKKVRAYIGDKWQTHPDEWNQCVGGWRALKYRFRSCADSDEAFTESWRNHGGSPPEPNAYDQDREIFIFFAAGLSAIESFCYALYAIGYRLKPQELQLAGGEPWRHIKPEVTHQKFKEHFEQDTISGRLQGLLKSDEYKTWKNIRNVFIHRAVPRREVRLHPTIKAVGIVHASYEVLTKVKDCADDSNAECVMRIDGTIRIDETTTASRRKWLADTIKELLESTRDFVQKHLR